MEKLHEVGDLVLHRNILGHIIKVMNTSIHKDIDWYMYKICWSDGITGWHPHSDVTKLKQNLKLYSSKQQDSI